MNFVIIIPVHFQLLEPDYSAFQYLAIYKTKELR